MFFAALTILVEFVFSMVYKLIFEISYCLFKFVELPFINIGSFVFDFFHILRELLLVLSWDVVSKKLLFLLFYGTFIHII